MFPFSQDLSQIPFRKFLQGLKRQTTLKKKSESQNQSVPKNPCLTRCPFQLINVPFSSDITIQVLIEQLYLMSVHVIANAFLGLLFIIICGHVCPLVQCNFAILSFPWCSSDRGSLLDKFPFTGRVSLDFQVILSCKSQMQWHPFAIKAFKVTLIQSLIDGCFQQCLPLIVSMTLHIVSMCFGLSMVTTFPFFPTVVVIV